MQPILEIKKISKKFHIGHGQRDNGTIRDSLVNLFKPSIKSDEFFALQDISFEVSRGKSLGIVGRNGAGKSTLLKILSKITPPTSGSIISRGRIASMLEVGTGFHSELSGRENIFFNGSILGMKRREIISKFDEIVSFSGVDKFLDTPIKHYSSGMQLRLAFAVAAFLDPEILVVDEVLSVGDAEFQKKCIGKMEDVSKEGRTILFVSHNLSMLSTLCTEGVLLDKGRLLSTGPIDSIVSDYFNLIGTSVYTKTWEETDCPSDNYTALSSVRFIDKSFQSIKSVSLDESFGVEMIYHIKEKNLRVSPNIHVFNSFGECAFVSIAPTEIASVEKGEYKVVLWLKEKLMNAGIYHFGFALTSLPNMHVHLYEKNCISLEIIENIGKRTNLYQGIIPGVVRPELSWELK